MGTVTVKAVLAGIDGITVWQEDLYRDLHRHPELGMQERRTTRIIADQLAGMGFAVHEIGGGVIGVLENGAGRCILFRADIDALPVREATGLPYESTDTATTSGGHEVPVMHACGHDMHVAAALGAARLLASQRDAWTGTCMVVFQPGEEMAAGARSMVDAGLVDRVPRPDVALAQHVLGAVQSGNVGTASGPVLSTATSLRITVHGRGSHGSMPHLGVDPVLLASTIVVRLQSIVARELAPGEFGVVTVGSLQAGTSANVIPADASLLVNVRAYDEAVRDRIIESIGRIVRTECEGARSPRDPEIEVYDAYPLTINDADATRLVTAALRDALGADRVEQLAPQTASEDFSILPDAWGVPYVYWGFGAFTPDQQPVANHNPGFAPALQPTLRTGTEAALAAILAFLAR